jgi:hypothetical protein
LPVTLRVELGLRGGELLLRRLAADYQENGACRQSQRQRQTEHAQDERGAQRLLFAGPDLPIAQTLRQARGKRFLWLSRMPLNDNRDLRFVILVV